MLYTFTELETSRTTMEISRQTIGGFFGHTEVPRISLTDMSDTSTYKYIVEPKIKRNEDLKEITVDARPSKPKKNIYYWLCRVNDIIGLQHLFMIAVLVIYSVIGALLFYIQESRNEIQVVPIKEERINKMIMDFAKEFKNEQLTTNVSQKAALFKEDYKKLLKFDGVYKWSTYYKTDEHRKWNFFSSIFFAMNLYTTVGYGTISAETILGIWMTMLYTTLFCPVSMVISRDLGQWALVYITQFYGYVKLKFTSQNMKALMTGDEQIMLPVQYTILLLLIPLSLTSTFLKYYDDYMGSEPGLTWFESFYFSCQTYTTAGFGDIMPVNATFDPLVSTVFFFCLPLQKVVNRMQYLYMENGIHGYFAVLESRMNKYWNLYHSVDFSYESDTNSQIHEKEANSDEFGATTNLTIRSIANMAESPADVFGGHLGRVNVRPSDLEPSNKIFPSRTIAEK